jgi:hypothetical protein
VRSRNATRRVSPARFKQLRVLTAVLKGLIDTSTAAGCEEATLVLAHQYGIEEDLLPLLGHQTIRVARKQRRMQAKARESYMKCVFLVYATARCVGGCVIR